MNLQNRLILSAVGATLIVLIFFGFTHDSPIYFFGSHASSTPTDNYVHGEVEPAGEAVEEQTTPIQNKPSVIPTGWSTYRNTKYHYSFIYPNGAILSTDTNLHLTTLPEAYLIHVYPQNSCTFPCYGITVRVVDDRKDVAVADLATIASAQRSLIISDVTAREATYTANKITATTLGGKNAYKFNVNEQTTLKGVVNDWDTTYVLVEHSGKFILFSYTPGNDDTTKILDSISFAE